MSEGKTGVDHAAASILTRAVQLDTSGRYTESLVLYQEGLQLLMDNWRGMPSGNTKEAMKKKMEEYMGRAEKIKKIVQEQQEQGSFHEELKIPHNSTGYDYETVMGRFFDSDVVNIEIQDPYIRNHTQFCNLVHFCELAVKKCANLKTIKLMTTLDSKNEVYQESCFKTLSDDLQKNFKIILQIEYSKTLHDRQIVLSNGWIIKIGRGLDYFNYSSTKYCLGMFDLHYRQCRETKVDIYHQKNTLHK